jgi:hypothetical protein
MSPIIDTNATISHLRHPSSTPMLHSHIYVTHHRHHLTLATDTVVNTLAKKKVLLVKCTGWAQIIFTITTAIMHHVISENPKLYINRKLLQRLVGYLTTLSAPSTVSREMTKADKPEWIWKETIVA